MKKNMGTIDRLLRATIGAAIVVLALAGQLHGTLAVVLGVIAVIFLGTAAVGFCPAYWLFGISTLKAGEHDGTQRPAH